MRADLRDSLDWLYADSTVGERSRRSMTVDVARGGTASVHLLLDGLEEGQSVQVRASRSGRGVEEAQWFRLIDVPVETNTGPVGFVERDGEKNPHVTRRAPFRVFDAMEPIRERVKAEAPTVALRVHLPVPTNARPGKRTYRLEVHCGKEKQALSLTVNVRKPVIPAIGRETLPYTNWFSLAIMAERHGLKPGTEAHWRMIKRYAELMAHGRQNTFWLPLHDLFEVKRGKPILDRAKMRRLVKTFTNAGMHWIEGGHVASRTGGDWEATTFDLALTKTLATSIEGNTVLASMCGQLMEEIDRNGWRDRWIQHVTDEPTADNRSEYRIIAGMVRKYMPGIPLLDATMDTGLAGSVDLWCPQAQEYQRHRKEFEALRALGDHVWYYTCCFPGGPWLNRLLDMELLRPCLFGWAAALYDLEGFLHWGLNHYKSFQDPFEQSVVDHGGSNQLPAGDTHIVYPGANGPWSSLRLEAQREGFEDFELLKQLKQRDEKKALPILRKAIRGFDKYTKNVGTLRAAREAMLGALSR